MRETDFERFWKGLNMPDISLRFHKDMLVLEGAMGTMLHRLGVDSEGCAESLNLFDPDVVSEIHRLYHIAGAHCAITNTFGGTRHKLNQYGFGKSVEDFNRAAVRIAREQKPQHILADVGPCGLVMQPIGTATFQEMFSQYYEQVTALAKERPDAIFIETMTDIADARCALLAAKEACDLPVFVSCTFGENGRMELSGTDPATAAIILEAAGADVVGINCGLGPEQIYPLVLEMAAATTLPLAVQPNAGIPTLDRHGKTVFPGKPFELEQWAWKYYEAGVQFLGSCCGSTPAFTSMLYANFDGMDVKPRKRTHVGEVVLAGPRGTLYLGGENPVASIGERINPTGKKALAEELRSGSLSMVKTFAREQESAGAMALDINVGAADVDAQDMLPKAVNAVLGISNLPLVLDSTDVDALSAALRIYPGRALINSVNGNPESYEQIFPLAKKYGAAVVILALDEKGIPESADERFAIIERVREAAHNAGLRDCDLVVDALTMTAATNESAPDVTLETLRLAHEQGLATVLGVSNVSHGLPGRTLLNAAFVKAAAAAGLSAAIMNPNDSHMQASLELAASQPSTFEDEYAAWKQILARAYEDAFAPSELVQETPENMTAEDKLVASLLAGDAQSMPALVDELVAAGNEPTAIITDILTPAIQRLGDAFGRGEAFLPQLIVAAEAMKAATSHIKTLLPEGDASMCAGTVIFCTVKGDVHSIGKDICISLLESRNFRVVDLGVDVDPQDVCDAAIRENANVVALSSLMTTTLPAMQKTVELLHEQVPNVAVLVGGAVVTDEWAKRIGAEYSSDAPSCVGEVARAVQIAELAN